MLNIFGTKMEVELPDIVEEIFEKDVSYDEFNEICWSDGLLFELMI